MGRRRRVDEADDEALPGKLALGEYVYKRRKALGWSQEQLAEQLEESQNYVSRLEHGITRGAFPPPEMARRLARALGVTMDDLWRAAGYEVLDTEQVAGPKAFAAMHDIAGRANLSPKTLSFVYQAIDLARGIHDAMEDEESRHNGRG